MSEEKKFLTLLQVTVPPDTALTVPAQVKILEMLGILNGAEMVKAADIAVGLVPANTPATLHGLIILLGNLVKHHPKADKSHHDELAKTLKDVSSLPDGPLSFGSFLTICESLMKAMHQKPARSTHKSAAK
jgi:hypothetical protein